MSSLVASERADHARTRGGQPRVAFVSYRAARVDGDGGNHRTHQLLWDLAQEFGPEQVWSLNVEDWVAQPAESRRRAGGPWANIRRARRRAARMMENPYKLLTGEAWSHGVRFGTRGVLSEAFVATYEQRLREHGLDLCVVDHVMFDQVRAINACSAVPTVIAPQNIESLDVGRLQLDTALHAQAAGVDLANELRALAAYTERYAISKVEAALLGGIGLTCQLHAYAPRGELRQQLSQIARARAAREPDRNLFLFLGTAFHAPTRRSLDWFLANAAEHGLPAGARVVLVGNQVTTLSLAQQPIAHVEVRGRVSQAELIDLLTQTGTALVPHRMGFGAPTRLAELACAGVPTLTFAHVGYAVDVPPGVRVLENDTWSTVTHAMSRAMEQPTRVEPGDYADWENQMSRPLGRTLRQLVAP